ncbi:MAG: hypothetical protein HYX52_08530 [Chloroflexi bacterium]|nr:hypothetical protein [Chloroflexota bacterium]
MRATENYDGSVTIDWAMPAGAGSQDDVYQVGRRLPGESDFRLISATAVPRFTDRSLPPNTTNAHYQIVVRRAGPKGTDGVYGPGSAVASVNLNRAQGATGPRQTAAPRPTAGTSTAKKTSPIGNVASEKKPAQPKTPSPPKEKP